MVFLVMAVWYLIVHYHINILYPGLSWLPDNYTGLIPWLVLVAYTFFPSKTMFNPQGRLYFYNLIKQIFMTPFVPTTFAASWLADQFTSLTGPLKDFEYTICFYVNVWGDNNVNTCKIVVDLDLILQF
jgi:uncharacterized membrane protein SirB2